MKLTKILEEHHPWIIRIYTDGVSIRYELIDTHSRGRNDYSSDYMPLEELKDRGFILPYPDPFEILTSVKEAVFQNWIINIIKPRVKTINVTNVYHDANKYGPVETEEYTDTDTVTNFSIRHEWKPYNDVICYYITISLKNRSNDGNETDS